MANRTVDPKVRMRAQALRLPIAELVKALEESDIFGDDQAALTVYREVLTDVLKAKVAEVTSGWVVDALDKAETFTTVSYTLGVFRRVLIDTIEQRVDHVEDVIEKWFDAKPEDEPIDQADYAKQVVHFARLSLRGEL
jgi:hypothetical protein